MKKWFMLVLAAALLTGLGLGCGDKDKGINRGKEKPKTTDQGG
jgi:hypothetical protein